MKIALVILNADAARGGAERYTVDLAGALARRGHAVSMVAASHGPPIADVRVVSLPARGRTRVGRYRRFLDSLDSHLSHETYDIVHAMLPVRRCDVYHPHAGIAVEALAAGHLQHRNPVRRALARVFNRLNPRRRMLARVERELLTGARPPVVLCLSDFVKGEVRRHYRDLAGDRLATLFNAVDLGRFDPALHPEARAVLRAKLHIPDNATVALMIAQGFALKGLREAMAAIRVLNDRRLVLSVVGREDPAGWKRLAQSMGIAEQIIFAGPTNDPVPFYAGADFFLLPTHRDSCSLVVLEALAMGLPVISTRQNGACEVMTDGVEGRILPHATDRGAFAQALREMMDPGRRDAMRHASLALRPRLAYEAHLQTLEGIYAAAEAPATRR